MHPTLSLAILGLCSFVAAHGPLAQRQGYSYGGNSGSNSGKGGDDDNSSSVTATSTSAAAGASGTAVSAASTSGLHGGTVCSDLLCISGLVNGSTVQYVLQSKGTATFGWMAMGFGSTMANTPMVIMWPNSDGTMTLSQRKAPQEVMPTVDPSPPRVATANTAASDLTGSLPKVAFTIPADSTSATSQTIIWAFGTTNPEDKAEDATLVQHLESGPISIDMSQVVAESDVAHLASPATDPNSTSGTVDVPLVPYQKMIIAHGLLCTIGFLIMLPAGALLARYSRTFTNAWFLGHWVFQFAFAGPVIISGIVCGIEAVKTQGVELDDDHKKWGFALLALYVAQLALGAVIHWIKPTSWTIGKRRPAQNYFHAVLGILIIALAFYQVRTGFRTEWPAMSGRPPISNAANIVWYIWVVLVPVLYFAGLALLPRQFRMERPHRKAPSDEYTN
ncbi:uncharacterized protein TRAVEDRAFT_161917 [Trametes versicolor FP-101664 SS1]|uniref:uncharacterized protein n=1 Tax=Trametes versicolor (strain FP-101664) TaxID=717944 RepID=UPI0004622B50|nr:uncharacterized protein TRAVEDRAFT_161917 [Trametes versicolor FP-101664 SS1]EIW63574.1 hypothetical protein TRAVEDRAFT_161917 [Trametes versicolor FP-101664 SS1]